MFALCKDVGYQVPKPTFDKRKFRTENILLLPFEISNRCTHIRTHTIQYRNTDRRIYHSIFEMKIVKHFLLCCFKIITVIYLVEFHQLIACASFSDCCSCAQVYLHCIHVLEIKRQNRRLILHLVISSCYFCVSKYQIEFIQGLVDIFTHANSIHGSIQVKWFHCPTIYS